MREVVLFAKNKRFGLRTHAVQVIHERRFKSRPVFKIHFRSCLHKPSVPPAVFLQWFLPISLQAVYEQIVVIYNGKGNLANTLIGWSGSSVCEGLNSRKRFKINSLGNAAS